jgi:hypothetical protein
MEAVEVQIRGVSALLMHGFGLDFENGDQSRTIVRMPKTPREQAEAVAERATCLRPCISYEFLKL